LLAALSLGYKSFVAIIPPQSVALSFLQHEFCKAAV
jgi:hypothetical protein